MAPSQTCHQEHASCAPNKGDPRWHRWGTIHRQVNALTKIFKHSLAQRRGTNHPCPKAPDSTLTRGPSGTPPTETCAHKKVVHGSVSGSIRQTFRPPYPWQTHTGQRPKNIGLAFFRWGQWGHWGHVDFIGFFRPQHVPTAWRSGDKLNPIACIGVQPFADHTAQEKKFQYLRTQKSGARFSVGIYSANISPPLPG